MPLPIYLGIPCGTYPLHQSALRRAGQGGLGVLLGFDYSKRHEIAGGNLITTATVDLQLNGVTSTDLLITSVTVDMTGTKVQFRVSDVSSVIGNEYRAVSQVTLVDGTVLDPESLSLPVVGV